MMMELLLAQLQSHYYITGVSFFTFLVFLLTELSYASQFPLFNDDGNLFGQLHYHL